MTTVSVADTSDLQFYRTDVLTSEIDKAKRKQAIDEAIKSKSDTSVTPQIIVKTKNGYKRIKSRIISHNRSKISLTGALRIPVRSIVGIAF